MAKKNYVLDTSVCLTDADVIYKFDNHDIFIPLKVLEEIDGHKKRQDSVGSNARQFIRTLDTLRKKANLEKGVRIAKGLGMLKVVSYAILKEVIFPPDLDMRHPDHTIIATIPPTATAQDAPTVLLSSHMDTVQQTSAGAIRNDGKRIHTDERHILGADDRGGIAEILEGVRGVLEEQRERARTILIGYRDALVALRGLLLKHKVLDRQALAPVLGGEDSDDDKDKEASHG